eukprot:scaffold710_cov171-Amphora_coffeaeformis.AAC.20
MKWVGQDSQLIHRPGRNGVGVKEEANRPRIAQIVKQKYTFRIAPFIRIVSIRTNRQYGMVWYGVWNEKVRQPAPGTSWIDLNERIKQQQPSSSINQRMSVVTGEMRKTELSVADRELSSFKLNGSRPVQGLAGVAMGFVQGAAERPIGWSTSICHERTCLPYS